MTDHRPEIQPVDLGEYITPPEQFADADDAILWISAMTREELALSYDAGMGIVNERGSNTGLDRITMQLDDAIGGSYRLALERENRGRTKVYSRDYEGLRPRLSASIAYTSPYITPELPIATTEVTRYELHKDTQKRFGLDKVEYAVSISENQPLDKGLTPVGAAKLTEGDEKNEAEQMFVTAASTFRAVLKSQIELAQPSMRLPSDELLKRIERRYQHEKGMRAGTALHRLGILRS
jgi:hypothetical protein